MVKPRFQTSLADFFQFLRTFFKWWASELASMAPIHLRRVWQRVWGSEIQSLLLRLDDDRLVASTLENGREELISETAIGKGENSSVPESLIARLADVDVNQYRVILFLDSTRIICRTTKVPLAAESELDDVLAFEIERLTPFHSDDVYFTYNVVDRDQTEKNLTVDLIVAPHKFVDPLVKSLQNRGLRPDIVTAMTADLSPNDIRVRLPVAGIHERHRATSTTVKFAWALSALLAFAAVSSPLFALKSVARDLHAKTQQVMATKQKAKALNREADRLGDGVRLLVSAKSTAPSPLSILEVLSRLLPDDTWLVQCNIVGQEVTLEGRTTSSAKLIGILEASPMFSSVKYLSPITRETKSGIERFNFALKLAKR